MLCSVGAASPKGSARKGTRYPSFSRLLRFALHKRKGALARPLPLSPILSACRLWLVALSGARLGVSDNGY